MRFSAFGGKEIVNLDSGERLGFVGQADLEIDGNTGEIQTIILPSSAFLGFGKRKEDVIIPWNSVRKIGSEMMIVELKQRVRAYE